jgi:mono/diheme cytochrome c family protein
MTQRLSLASRYAICFAVLGSLAAFAAPPAAVSRSGDRVLRRGTADPDQVLRGRFLTLTHACGNCHGGGTNPAASGWLAGIRSPQEEFLIGPCGTKPADTTCFRTRPRNLTPDNTTGMGRFSERQVFNALRYGLRPGETPDLEITSATPGQGNFPAHPKYLAPPMPWPSWRYMPDPDLWAIAAYLKWGVKPQSNKVADSDGPTDFWASEYTVEKLGPYPAAAYPTANERPLR